VTAVHAARSAFPRMPGVAFLCTGNSCRSQMAEGWLRHLHGAHMRAFSAGTHPTRLNPLAVRAMAEVGVDISGHTSKSIDALPMDQVDLLVTVCGDAHDRCPIVPGKRVIHQGFDDPPRLAANAGSDDEAMLHYRRVRDEIREFVQKNVPVLLRG
jgi:arsenate reductase